MAQKHSPRGALANGLKGTPLQDLEVLAGNDKVMRDLILVLRREVADYIQKSFSQDEDQNYIVKPNSLHPSHENSIANPKVVKNLIAEGIIRKGDPGAQTFEEKLQAIRTPGARPSEAMEYDALSRIFNCPFADIVVKTGLELKNVADAKVCGVRSYPLRGANKGHTLDELRNNSLNENKTFALLGIGHGHTNVLFRQ